MVTEVPLAQRLTSEARYDGQLPADLIAHCAEHVGAYDVDFTASANRLQLTLPEASLKLTRDAEGFTLHIEAETELRLHQARENAQFLLDHVCPEAAAALAWTGRVARNTTPPSFHHASVRSVRRVGPRFLRVELDCAGTAALATGGGMHFSLLLPPGDGAPEWPRIDDRGRTIWPEGDRALHLAAYTFVTLDPEAERFSFDVFEHDGGRTTEWARTVTPGTRIGVMGPGGGDFPQGRDLLIAGDETALPAIRRILETSAPDRRGTALIEVTDATDQCPIACPEGIRLIWIDRSTGDSLARHLEQIEMPAPGSRFVWVAAERSVIRRAKSRIRGTEKLTRAECYLSAYWVAPPA
ncbi:siderophore-interacting protein [Marinibacterium profundimaris]|uniref:FAD-binding FR-type domain-containing protein n=1 Tax=Marinibacterium profundimaris TaxID=1679460 RepID=A0A225NI46_9RHOB|nr:siderophore-interacting protein [Marinibacterium profundimaris]OWU71009.1 hypothetical protein ATO3_19430 [Marinibacterium profundimaris]